MTPSELIAWHAHQITFLPATDNAMVQHHRDAMHCIERLRADAERYRWLKSTPWSDKTWDIIAAESVDLWDAAIDAARKP